MARAFNKKVRSREFKAGDLVLKRIDLPGGKFDPKWEGPYVVKDVYSTNAFRLADSDGIEHIKPTNVGHLKQYYA